VLHVQVSSTKLVQSEQLLELDQGEWEGALRSECFTPELTAQFAVDPWVSSAQLGRRSRRNGSRTNPASFQHSMSRWAAHASVAPVPVGLTLCITPAVQGHAFDFKPPGGESQRQVEERMVDFLQQHVLPKLAPGAPAIVVSHGMAMKCVLRHVLQSIPTMSRNIALANTSITELGFVPSKDGSGQGEWHVQRVNNLEHLPFELRS
jgi:broad specificity phosphatase PhoE